jgi:valacyclovir hydrolase
MSGQTITIDQHTIYYQVVGTRGEPLLLMHGWGDTGDDLLPLAYEVARQGFRAFVVDRPGYGRSVPPYRTYPPDFYHRDARVMGGLLDALGLRDVHMMGFSDGGEVALIMPILRPDLCQSVVAWGAVGSFPEGMCERQRRGLPHQWVLEEEFRARHPGQDITVWPQQWVDAICAAIEQHGGDLSLSQAHTIGCPLLIILGDQDRLNPIEYGRKFVDRIPDQRGALEVFPGIGHSVHTESPLGFLSAITIFWGKVKRQDQ